jgi:sensor histidine kinase YesM
LEKKLIEEKIKIKKMIDYYNVLAAVLRIFASLLAAFVSSMLPVPETLRYMTSNAISQVIEKLINWLEKNQKRQTNFGQLLSFLPAGEVVRYGWMRAILPTFYLTSFAPFAMFCTLEMPL